VVILVASVLSAVLAYAVVSALVSDDPAQSPEQTASQGQQASTSSTRPAWLGVDTTSSPVGGGALVMAVSPGSPANAAGLEPGDIITSLGNNTVQSPADIQSALSGLHAGQQVQIAYYRGPISLTTEATLTKRPNSP
jgi:S1-C subfamily serine protease